MYVCCAIGLEPAVVRVNPWVLWTLGKSAIEVPCAVCWGFRLRPWKLRDAWSWCCRFWMQWIWSDRQFLAKICTSQPSNHRFGKGSATRTRQKSGRPSVEMKLNFLNEKMVKVPSSTSRGCMKDTSSSETVILYVATDATIGRASGMTASSVRTAKGFGVTNARHVDPQSIGFLAKIAQIFPRLIVLNASMTARHYAASAMVLIAGLIAVGDMLLTAKNVMRPCADSAWTITAMIAQRRMKRRRMNFTRRTSHSRSMP